MSHETKTRLAHLGAKVRVADNGKQGPDRWKDAKLGTVASRPKEHAGAEGIDVLVDGAKGPRFVKWADLDIAEKPRGHLVDVPISEVAPSRFQYRRRFDAGSLGELASSIARHGLINAILMFEREDGAGFELIAGERRLRAASALALATAHAGLNLAAAVGLTSARGWWADDPHLLLIEDSGALIRAELRKGTAEDWREVAVIENLQREDPSAIEESSAYSALMSSNGWTQKELAGHLGKSEAYVSQRLSLLGLSEGAKAATHAGEISFASARALAKVPAPVQDAVAAQVAEKLAGSEPATTRQVAAYTGQVRRFLEPDRWRPADGEVVAAQVRNHFRLLSHHVSELLAGDGEGAGEAVVALQNAQGTKLIGMKPATVADSDHLTRLALQALTGAEPGGYGGPDPWWRALALAEGYNCARCQWAKADIPAGSRNEGIAGAQCRRALQPEAKRGSITTCLQYIDPDEPVVLFLDWDDRRAVENAGAEMPKLGEGERGHDLPWATSVADHLAIRMVINAAEAKEKAELKKEKEIGHLTEIAGYGAAVAADAPENGLSLDHGLAQVCRRCRFHLRGLDEDSDLPPCKFAAEPLKAGNWPGAANRAPRFAILVSSACVSVPRCEKYQAAEVPAFAPIAGLRFPKTKGGRALVIRWLNRITRSDYNTNEHHGATPGFLAWVPYDRDPAETWDRDRLCRWVRDRWDDLGDAGVAHLLSSAALEAKAKGSHRGAIELLDYATGKIEKWGAVSFETWHDGTAPRFGYPQGWPIPWVKPDDGSGS